MLPSVLIQMELNLNSFNQFQKEQFYEAIFLKTSHDAGGTQPIET